MLRRHLLRLRARRLAIAAALVAAAAAAPAQDAAPAKPPPPCQSAEYRQFDFWIGRWEVFTPDGKKAGDNRIEAIDGGCALLERWSGRGGFSGTSLNSWDAEAKQWRQHWVDSQGGLLRLAGALEGQRMVLGASVPHDSKPGVTVQERIGWTPQPDGSVRQLWQRSEDGGRSWSTVFDGRYARLP
jgi:hypothetical protein